MTTENNKIIAEFMGYIDNGCSEEGFLINPITNFDEEINDLRYHLDWNWLIEVVEKIYQTELYYNKYIDFNASMFTDGKIELSTKIDLVYNQCVEFIKWYNEQNKV